jgi:tetratricopeptide (TPR) repeat protein/transcriptional regulator with XRE-family HTH domain
MRSGVPTTNTPRGLVLLRVRNLRDGKGWSQEVLADEANVSVDTIQRAEAGRPALGLNAQKIARALGVTVAELTAAPSGALPEPPPPPERPLTASNIPIRVPEHFMGREEALAEIERGLARYEGRVAITALHGLRGVGKTVLAAAYAERHRRDYRATWWLRGETEPGMRADLVGLGVRLGWVAPDEKEEPALAAVFERLRHEGDGILLIYDNAISADAIRPYLPRGGAARILVTSNAPAWRGLAEPVEIRLWPKEIGADYLIARTGRSAERAAAEVLSEALGGLPLAHEQAAAYCERLEIPLAEYRRRFEATPARLLDAERDAPAEYHDRLTVAKTFALAIAEAAKLHPAAEPLLVHAALLAPEPIPLFLFAEAREKFGKLLASALAEDGLDEAVAALRAFALVDRETIPDERNPVIATDTIRLHRLVRQIAALRREGTGRDTALCALNEAMAAVYLPGGSNDPRTWPRKRRLDPLGLALVGDDAALPAGAALAASDLLNEIALYRQSALAVYCEARPLFERALAIRKKVLGPEHPSTAASLNNLALLLRAQGDLAAARPLLERALAIHENSLGPDHPLTATNLNNLALLLQGQGDLAAAWPLHERALATRKKALGLEHPDTAQSLSNLAFLLWGEGDLAAARPLYECALAICERALGPEHPDTATNLNNLAFLLGVEGDLAAARPLHERALAIREKALGPEHPDTATSLNNLALLLQAEGEFAAARPLLERALAIFEKALGPDHPLTAGSLNNLAELLRAQGDLAAARPLYERALAICGKPLGPEHPDTATSLNNLARLLQDQGDLAAARPLYERALAIREKVLGPAHPDTALSLNNLACLLQDQGDHAAARPLYERALAINEKVFGLEHPDTATSLNSLAFLLRDRGDLAAARPFYERVLAIREDALGPDHPDTASSLNKLANLLYAQGDLAAAGQLFERALAIHEKALGPEHPDTATSLNNFAFLLQALGDLAAARPFYERALAIREKVLGPEHPDSTRSLNNLAFLLRDQGDLVAARPLFVRALAIHEKVLGPEHPTTVTVRQNLALLDARAP